MSLQLARYLRPLAFWERRGTDLAAKRQQVASIQQRVDDNSGIRDEEIRRRWSQLQTRRRQASAGAVADLLVEAFTLVTLAAQRTLGIRYYDVQLLAGLALVQRAIAEMQTGEGKTFTAALPAAWYSLSGAGVHVMTVNAYLAERDYGTLRPLFQLLGVSVGILFPGADPDAKQSAYACDVTYGPGYEFGFDYLRDQCAALQRRQPKLGERQRDRLRGVTREGDHRMQRGLAVAIVDEIDSVLIDEATTPLILTVAAGQPAEDADAWQMARQMADVLREGADYELDRGERRVELTAEGQRHASEALAGSPGLILHRPWSLYVEQSLYASRLLRRDVDYVLDGREIRLVDPHTGRIFTDRSWRHGLQQAVQARERLPITADSDPLARISRQRFLKLYGAICGMTGTARGAEREFYSTYGLTIQPIPTRLPGRRRVLPMRFFADQDAKWRAISLDVQQHHAAGRPVLLGTRTIEQSQRAAHYLTQLGVPYQLLNGRQDETEASIVARAGEAGAVTVATNMAGRGTDIRLGPGVAERGGLHVIGSEPHESARVDRQLIGRSARQGDPGSCRFYVSADDALLTQHDASLAAEIRLAAAERGESLQDFSDRITQLQQRLERLQRMRRQRLVAHDTWLDEVLARLGR